MGCEKLQRGVREDRYQAMLEWVAEHGPATTVQVSEATQIPHRVCHRALVWGAAHGDLEQSREASAGRGQPRYLWARATPGKEERRYRIMSDGDHQYVVPLDQAEVFDAALEAHEAYWYGDPPYQGPTPPDLESIDGVGRIDGRFTFTDPRCA